MEKIIMPAIIVGLIWGSISYWVSGKKNKKHKELQIATSEKANEIETVNRIKIGGIEIETEAVKLIDSIYEILTDEGFRPLLYENEHYIEFKIEGDVIRIQFYEEDENYIQLGSWVYDYEQKDKHSALDTANQVNIYVKYAYIAVHSNQIIAHSDIYIDNSMDIKAVLFKYIPATLFARNEFYRITNEPKYSLN
jgi:hypothetical protein